LAIETASNDMYYAERGWLNYLLKRHQEAINDYLKASTLKPDDG
jgi:hypothetical protein